MVTRSQAAEQRGFGDHLSHDERYARTAEFLAVVRGAWSGQPFDFSGQFYQEPPAQVAQKLAWIRGLASAEGRELRFGIRLHVTTRDIEAEAWAVAVALLDHFGPCRDPERPAGPGRYRVDRPGPDGRPARDWFGEGVRPELRRRGAWHDPAAGEARELTASGYGHR